MRPIPLTLFAEQKENIDQSIDEYRRSTLSSLEIIEVAKKLSEIERNIRSFENYYFAILHPGAHGPDTKNQKCFKNRKTIYWDNRWEILLKRNLLEAEKLSFNVSPHLRVVLRQAIQKAENFIEILEGISAASTE